MPTYSGIWSLSQQFQGRGQGLWPTVPGAPTIGTASVANVGVVSVTFTAPTCTGIPAGITGYIAKSTPGCFTATGSSSPITISGLCSSTAYTFAVAAQNATGYGTYSAQSNSVTPNAVVGQQAYTTPGTYSWVAPAGVTKVSVVVVGGGGGGGSYCGTWPASGLGGGGGGALAYTNNYSVTPGSSYTVVVGAGGGAATSGNPSRFMCGLVTANGGNGAGAYPGANGGSVAFGTGGSGGNGGGSCCYYGGGGGGGAGGYSGNGGNGGGYGGSGTSSSGGGGGGGGAGSNQYRGGGGGGGVGILGLGSSGSGSGQNTGGGAGSGGGAGFSSTDCRGASGGQYGGGGGGSSGENSGGSGRDGAVRIIWPGNTRSFPSTCTGNL